MSCNECNLCCTEGEACTELQELTGVLTFDISEDVLFIHEDWQEGYDY